MKIYALADFELLREKSITFEEYIEICKKNCVEIIQYRDKISRFEIKRENLRKLRRLWRGTLIINDEIDLVDECDGIHLGQEDLAKIDKDFKKAIYKLRKEIGDKIIGISTHNREEIEITNSLDIDYIGLGAYRGTTTKRDAKILGEELPKIAKYSNKRVGAIGGVTLKDRIENVDYLVIGRGLFEN